MVGIDITANDGYNDYPLFVTGRVVEDETKFTIKTCVSFGEGWEEPLEFYEITIAKSDKTVLFDGGSSASSLHLSATAFKIYKIL